MKKIISPLSAVYLIIFALPHASFAELVTKIIATNETDQKNISVIQEEVEKMLPPRLYHYLLANKDNQKSPKNFYTIEVKDYHKHIAGASSKSGIVVNAALIADKNLIKRTLIHEWAHIYDHLNLHSKDHIKKANECANVKASGKVGPSYCSLYGDLKSTVSSLPEFLEVAGWFLKPNKRSQRIAHTAFSLRTPDFYELQNSHEMFAVNMEYFLLDPEFKCRRPSMYGALKQHFAYEPFSDFTCKSPLRILTPAFKDAKRATPIIDPSRIYQIHYLLADRGTGLSSNFGHSMFRLIMCNPSRKEVGPECLKDIQNHLVLTYRAFVDTPEINNFAGLLGDYPSRLFFVPFLQVVEEYNKTELRDLYSYPIKLTQTEIISFVERSVEVHWTYNGQYKFISNNCAVESINLLRSVLRNEDFLSETALTPFSIVDVLASHNLIDERLLENRDLAVKNGYLYASYSGHFENALNIIAEYSRQTIVYMLDDWTALAASKRLTFFNRYLPFDNPIAKQRYIAAYLMLEKQAQRAYNVNLQNFLLEASTESSKDINETLNLIQEALEIKSGYIKVKENLVTPSHILKAGYGIPSDSDLVSIQKYLDDVAQKKLNNSKKLEELYAKIFDTKRFAEASEIQKNIEAFNAALKN